MGDQSSKMSADSHSFYYICSTGLRDHMYDTPHNTLHRHTRAHTHWEDIADEVRVNILHHSLGGHVQTSSSHPSSSASLCKEPPSNPPHNLPSQAEPASFAQLLPLLWHTWFFCLICRYFRSPSFLRFLRPSSPMMDAAFRQSSFVQHCIWMAHERGVKHISYTLMCLYDLYICVTVFICLDMRLRLLFLWLRLGNTAQNIMIRLFDIMFSSQY